MRFAFGESACSPDQKVQAKAVSMDFSQLNDEASWTRFADELEGLDIGILGTLIRDGLLLALEFTLLQVNNVGKSHQGPVDFAEAPTQEVEDILTINVNATVRVTKMILPGMVQRYVCQT